MKGTRVYYKGIPGTVIKPTREDTLLVLLVKFAKGKNDYDYEIAEAKPSELLIRTTYCAELPETS